MGFAQTFFKKRKKQPNEINPNSDVITPSLGSRSNSLRAASIPIEELEQVFIKFDVNGDGKISSAELGTMMRSLGQEVTEEEIQIMIKEVDADGDGYIDLNEFITLNTKDVDSDEILDNLKEAFAIYDADGNGNITAEELQIVMNSLGDCFTIDECKKMINGVDSDGDGTINFQEFKVMMMVGSRFNMMMVKD